MNDGGPAFPIATALKSRDGETKKMDVNEGMSLREWFTGMALQGILSRHADERGADISGLAALAYVYADAMIEQKE